MLSMDISREQQSFSTALCAPVADSLQLPLQLPPELLGVEYMPAGYPSSRCAPATANPGILSQNGDSQ